MKGSDNPTTLKAAIERFIQSAAAEEGPACEDGWFKQVEELLRLATNPTDTAEAVLEFQKTLGQIMEGGPEGWKPEWWDAMSKFIQISVPVAGAPAPQFSLVRRIILEMTDVDEAASQIVQQLWNTRTSVAGAPEYSDFEVGKHDLQFQCEWAVFPKSHPESSLCYTTSEERAQWISDRLNLANRAGAPVEQTDLGKPDVPSDNVNAVLQKEIQDSFALAESQHAAEKLSGNVVKLEYWKGELAVLHRLRRLLSSSGASSNASGVAAKEPVQCACTPRERDSGHRTDCNAPDSASGAPTEEPMEREFFDQVKWRKIHALADSLIATKSGKILAAVYNSPDDRVRQEQAAFMEALRSFAEGLNV